MNARERFAELELRQREAALGCVPACEPPVHRLPCPTAYAIQEAEWETR